MPAGSTTTYSTDGRGAGDAAGVCADAAHGEHRAAVQTEGRRGDGLGMDATRFGSSSFIVDPFASADAYAASRIIGLRRDINRCEWISVRLCCVLSVLVKVRLRTREPCPVAPGRRRLAAARSGRGHGA